MSEQELHVPRRTNGRRKAPPRGVLPSQGLRKAIDEGWVTSVYSIPRSSIQPASIDLRLGRTAYALRCSFLPMPGSTVMERVSELTLHEVDIRDGATLEVDRPYLIPLVEELHLPGHVRAKANPKSSTGRLDVFTRVITDGNNRFDEVTAGYEGSLYLEVVPRSFAVRVQELMTLNQLRISAGDPRVADAELPRIHEEFPLLYMDSHALPGSDLAIADGLFLSVDLSGPPSQIVGYRAKKSSHRLDLAQIRHYDWREYWEPVHPEAGGRVVLTPETFYLLLSAEGVCVPPGYAAEMMAYDPTAGELRTHYAGFFDPGFGYSRDSRRFGSRAALEVRARDVPFMVEHRQPICKLAFEVMMEEPDRLYGEDVGSNYQGQLTMLSKHFTEQTAGGSEGPAPSTEDAPRTEAMF